MTTATLTPTHTKPRTRHRATHDIRHLGEVSGRLARELRQPVTGIMAVTRALLEQTGPDDPRSGGLAMVESQAAYLDEIVKNLACLTPARPVQPLPSLLDEDVDAIVSRLKPILTKQHVRVSRRPSAGAPPACVDAELLQRALSNVLLNAVESMPNGGEIDVQIETAGAGRTVEIVIRDAGTGIPADRVARVCDPFATTKSNQAGLGLTAARYLAERQGGRLVIESEAGAGTTVRLTFPAATARGKIEEEQNASD